MPMVSHRGAGAKPHRGDAHEPEPVRLWTGSYLLAMVVQLGASIVFVTLMTYMAVYAMHQFDAQDSAAGFAASSFIMGSAMARIFLGKYVDFIGRKRLAVIALMVFVACSASYPLAWSYPALLVVRIVHGCAFGGISTAIISAVVGLVPPSRRGEGMGYFLASSTIAMALGPLLAVQLAEHFGPNGVFGMTGAASVLALVAAVIVRLPERTPGPGEYQHRFRLRLTDILDANALPVSLVVLLCAFGYAGIVTFLNPFLLERDMAAAASLYFVVFAGGMLAVRLVSGRLQDRRGDNSVIIPLTILFAVSLGLLGLAEEPWHVLVAGALAGLGYGGLLPSLQVVALARAGLDRVGTGMSTHYLMLDSGVALGPVIFGFIVPYAGYQGLYLALAGTVLAAVVLYCAVHGRRPAAT